MVVYRSIPLVLSAIRETRISAAGTIDGEYVLCQQFYRGGSSDEETPLFKLMLTQRVRRGACFALMGPPGTHKLALAMNLAGGYVLRGDDTTELFKHRKVLIVSFGGYAPIRLGGVAWFDFRERWASLEDSHALPGPSGGQKCWTAEFRPGPGASTAYDDEGGVPEATQLMFRIGHLTPEECFDTIERTIKKDDTGLGSYSSVVVADTAEICTGFPLLRMDPLFVPALVELVPRVGIGLGVHRCPG